ncbi:MAG: hypothetical protein QF915_03225 [Candidatus Woesearchaeota archaeon]|nr:hypothetical protein [Candidatus Woesearchaeota archaeon]
MDKKGQGISINVIIVAAIALLVLVILSVIFIGRVDIFTKRSADCGTYAGASVCADSCGEGDAEGFPTPYPSLNCANDGEGCCIKIST